MFPQNYYFYRMKRQLCTIAMTVMTLVGAAAAGSDSLSRWVNPMIGTNGMGHTFPGACWPFGIVQLSPDTDTVPHNIDGRYQPEAYRKQHFPVRQAHPQAFIVGTAAWK